MGARQLAAYVAIRMSTLFVGNLGWSTSSETLSTELSKFGTIQSCDTGTERNGRTRGWALVEMATPDEANNVISACNGLEVEGRPLVVKLDAKPERAPRAPRERKEKAPTFSREPSSRSDQWSLLRSSPTPTLAAPRAGVPSGSPRPRMLPTPSLSSVVSSLLAAQ